MKPNESSVIFTERNGDKSVSCLGQLTNDSEWQLHSPKVVANFYTKNGKFVCSGRLQLVESKIYPGESKIISVPGQCQSSAGTTFSCNISLM